jgi:hypothetical protein
VQILRGREDRYGGKLVQEFATHLGAGTGEMQVVEMPSRPVRPGMTILQDSAPILAHCSCREASRCGFGTSLYSEAGVDGTMFWPITHSTTLATHVGLRYMPSVHQVAFWELSSVGGDRNFVGGEQPLRGFGAGRFIDRNASSFTTELRHNVFGVDLFKTQIELEVSPFVDLGKVFPRPSTSPLSKPHKVYGVGFRRVARPFIVGYVDVAHGEEGMAVFTGIDYPF